MIDWDKPIEAVHNDGCVVPARYKRPAAVPGCIVEFADEEYYVNTIGKIDAPDWTIRNVVNEQPAWRTSAEQLDRMDALVQRLATAPIALKSASDEARAILAAREPVDPRFEKVRAAIAYSHPALADSTTARMVRDVLAALDK